jgi:hypothetical protein
MNLILIGVKLVSLLKDLSDELCKAEAARNGACGT